MEKNLYRIMCTIGSKADKEHKDNKGLAISILAYDIVSIKNKYYEIKSGDLFNSNKRISKEKINIIYSNFNQSVNLLNREVWTDNKDNIDSLIKDIKEELNKSIKEYELLLNNLKDNFYNKEETIENIHVSELFERN